ncbi:MAG TPA: pseudouridine synthase [Thermodesulfobacteriota bacterium]|nr:pseudouridine synthase [Thermodesulfobacteriota bacterium]
MKKKSTEPPSLLRLQRFLAQAGVASRRKAEDLIREGRVRVDGRTVSELGFKVDPAIQRIEVDGRLLPTMERKAYYLFYKPKGVLSTLQDPQGRPTLKDFLDRKGIRERLFPVGRLDWDAEGLMLLTNDGELGQKLQHPKYQIPKTYRIKVKGVPTDEALQPLAEGLQLASGKSHRAEWERLKAGEDRSWLLLTIREGEKHQVKDMMAVVGFPVMAIKRVAMGPLSLGRLTPGEMRPLTPKELQDLPISEPFPPLKDPLGASAAKGGRPPYPKNKGTKRYIR